MRLRRLKRTKTATTRNFERELALEILKSDKLRVTILIWALAAVVPVSLALAVLGFEDFQRAFNGNFRSFVGILLGVLVICLGFLTLERVAIDRLIRERRTAYPGLPYISALLETSLPLAALVIAAQYVGPAHALLTPAPFVYPLLIVLSTLRLDYKLSVFTGAIAASQYLILSFVFISQAPASGNLDPMLWTAPPHIVKSFLLLLTGIATGAVAVQIKKRLLKSFEIVEERNRISRTFGEYVSPIVMNKLLTLKPDLRSEKREVCVMFLDIRDFTGFAEKRSPEEVVSYLESLFEFMIEIVNRHHGVINKFLGDGFMAVFGAPLSEGGDCLNGVAAAREILTRVEEEVASGHVLPTTVGIGLHAGEAVTGSIGSSLRKEYTVIGDVVNLASRIEKLNKRFQSRLLISENVWQSLGEGSTDAIPMGNVQVQGRESGIGIYQLA
ncbi:MAG TPA: adenylate/guanylate cyclase domain-containing protein [Pyrinomonadaceae bacterium]|nr:adenylate/guanylate cyclase domain-containing protein [Pyrinomonadaceae bacterium]